MSFYSKDEILYGITVECLQENAKERIGRDLNDDEIGIAKKCIEWGLNTSIDIVFTAAIQEATKTVIAQ
jgi:hypothetical protein